MGKKSTKKKAQKGGLIKQLSIILGIVVAVVVVAIVVVKAINKTTIKTITVEGAYSELYVGNPEFSKVEVGISVYPETASKASLMAYSADPAVATVNFDGEKLTVEAVGVGTTTITVRHASKSSLYDTMQITVKDVDVQTLTFVKMDGEGVASPIDSVDIKKDGFEHVIPFTLDPIDANMNNLKVEDYNSSIFESVTIDQERRALVVVPKTDVVQTSTEIDVEVYQNTTEGYDAVQVVTLLVNLTNREAHIRFNLSSNPSQGYSQLEYTGNTSSNNNIVYLEQSNNANDIYVLPEIGYDVNFENVGQFNLADYELYFDGSEVEQSDFNSEQEYVYNNKLMVSKARGNYYYFKTQPNFMDGDCIYVAFKHKYTGAISGLQFIYLDVASMGLDSNQDFQIQTETNLHLDEVVSLSFSYDIGIDRGVVEMYTFKFNPDGTRQEVYSFYDGEVETLSVKKDNKKLSIWARELTDGTVVNFGVRCNYWDSRYVRINEAYYMPLNFTVTHYVNGIHVEHKGVEKNLITVNEDSEHVISLVTEPEGGMIDLTKVNWTVLYNSVESEALVITPLEGETIKIAVPSVAAAGTYQITFEYNGFKTNFYVVVQ